MSILKFLSKNIEPKWPISVETDDPAFIRANDEIYKTVLNSGGEKRKRGSYNNYSPEIRAKIATYAVENGIVNAARKFSKELESPVNQSTVRSIKKSFLKVKTSKRRRLEFNDEPLLELPKETRGRPLLLGKYDQILQDYLNTLRSEGGIVSSQIVISTATGILKFHDKNFLIQIELTKSWAESVLSRMGFVRRKGTKSARSKPLDIEQIKIDFNDRVNKIVKDNNIPDELIINWDQTGVPIVPGGQWTMEKKGVKQVSIVGLDDKRQITVLMAASKSGTMLPPQVIYKGITDQCYPKYKFLSKWDIFHSENHWSTTDTMLRYIDNIIVPYVEEVREDMDLPLREKALAIFDILVPTITRKY